MLEAIEKHRGSYRKAIAGFAFSKDANEPLRPCYGFVTFVSEEGASLKELYYDYGNLVIVRKLLDVNDAIHMLQQMYEKFKLTLKGHPTIQFRGRLHNPQFVGSRYQYGYVKCKWPKLYASGGIDEGVIGKIPKHEMSTLQLPLLLSGDEAIRVLLDLSVPEGFYQLNNTIEIVVPDYRCRITNLVLSGAETTLEVELKTAKSRDIVAKFYVKSEKGVNTSADLQLRKGKAIFKADDEPRQVEARLLSVHDGAMIDRADFRLDREPNTNPNNVGRHHFERALELAARCQPEKPNKIVPMVGVVVVKDGEVIAEAFRGQTGSGDHAEYIALEQTGLDKTDFGGADLITTLEPCTTRNHGREAEGGKRPCADWIVLRKIRKVWIGALDRNPSIRGSGETKLQDARITIDRFPGDLAIEVLDLNRGFFDYITKKPKVPLDELRSIFTELKSEVRRYFEQIEPQVEEYWGRHQEGVHKKSKLRKILWGKEKRQQVAASWQDLQRGWLLVSILKDVRSEFDMADIKSSSYWNKLGNLLLQAHEAYLVPFDKHLAGANLFVNATLDTIYEGRERWDISSEMAYDRTSQPVSDGTLRSWFKLRKFPASLAWRAYSTAIQLDSENYEPWLGKAKVDLILRRFVDSYSSLKQVARIRSFDVSGGLVPASEIVGFDVASTLHWLARLIDIKHPTVAFPLIEPDLHQIQLEAVLEHIRITRRTDKVVDLIVLLLRRPLDLDSSTDPHKWSELGDLLTDTSQSKLGQLCVFRAKQLVDTGESSEDLS